MWRTYTTFLLCSQLAILHAQTTGYVTDGAQLHVYTFDPTSPLNPPTPLITVPTGSNIVGIAFYGTLGYLVDVNHGDIFTFNALAPTNPTTPAYVLPNGAGN